VLCSCEADPQKREGELLRNFASFSIVCVCVSLSLSLSLLVCILENAKCFGDQYTLIANYEELKDVGDRWCSTSIALQQLLGDEMLW
jgi:hypothetical protein